MFSNCTSFDGDVSAWDVSNGEEFQDMFGGCTNFNSDVSGWNVSRGRELWQMRFFQW
jgi:surface protein